MSSLDSGETAKSLGNVNRDDKTPIELFLVGLEGWNVDLKRHFRGENRDN
jgi:hypothetical protein